MYELKLDTNGRSVDAWSMTRLPFERRGELLQYRSDLRAALQGLRCTTREVLAACYVSAARDVCDVENVLLYNLGTSSFSHLAISAVELERFQAAPGVAPSGIVFPHHVRYELRDSSRGIPDAVAAFETAACSSGYTNPWSTWRALKQGRIERGGAIRPDSRRGIRVIIQVPRAIRRPLNLVKPVLDGLIAAMHCHDGSSLDIVGSRVALLTSLSPIEVERMLVDETTAILGRRRLVWSYREGVQMNPADDRFDRVIVEFQAGRGDQLVARGEMFTVS